MQHSFTWCQPYSFLFRIKIYHILESPNLNILQITEIVLEFTHIRHFHLNCFAIPKIYKQPRHSFTRISKSQTKHIKPIPHQQIIEIQAPNYTHLSKFRSASLPIPTKDPGIT
jgi:hypothetical protein